MSRDIETAVASVIGACLGMDRLVELSHSIRPLRELSPGTLTELERALTRAEQLTHNERLHRTREALSGRAA
jgi:hypothetical protein